jgi:hypothetical protein
MFKNCERSVYRPATVTFAIVIGLASVTAASAQKGTPGADPNRVPVEQRLGGAPIGVPTLLLVQLKKDLGESEGLPKTVALLAHELEVEKLSLVDPRNASSPRSFPQDVEFYWLSGPAANCGAGGRCSSQLYWASPSAATSGRLLLENAFNQAPSVLRRSSHGLFDLDLYQSVATEDEARPTATRLTFDGQRYAIQIKKKQP